MNTAALRALALSLPDATEQDHHGFPSFRVRGKIFATWPQPGHVHVMLAPDDIEDAVASFPDATEAVWWGKKLSAVRVFLDRIPDDVLEGLLREAWSRRAK